MNSFNINRFGQTFRWVVATNFRNFLAWTLGAGVGAFLMEMIFIALKFIQMAGITSHYYIPPYPRSAR
jgi:hypothetical protein